MEALRAPVVLGVNVMVTLHIPPTARLLGLSGQLLVSVKSVGACPVRLILLIVNFGCPWFKSVKLFDTGDPTVTLPKFSFETENTTTGLLNSVVMFPLTCVVTRSGSPSELKSAAARPYE